jgi:hypothetical protein
MDTQTIMDTGHLRMWLLLIVFTGAYQALLILGTSSCFRCWRGKGGEEPFGCRQKKMHVVASESVFTLANGWEEFMCGVWMNMVLISSFYCLLYICHRFWVSVGHLAMLLTPEKWLVKIRKTSYKSDKVNTMCDQPKDKLLITSSSSSEFPVQVQRRSTTIKLGTNQRFYAYPTGTAR